MTTIQSAALALILSCSPLAISQTESKAPEPQISILGQATFIQQQLFPFKSPYAGTNSLPSRQEGALSQTYTLYIGKRVTPNFELYLNPEMARGQGVGNAIGLAGYTNGEVIRNPSLDVSPYFARYMFRWNIKTGEGEEKVAEAPNQVAGTRPTHRITITGGKFGSNDIFDVNTYANSSRTQFANWALINNAAYDYAADTRGYTQGLAIEWVQPTYTLRLGSFQMPKVANGEVLDANISSSRGDQLELEVHPTLAHKLAPSTLRVLGYRNEARMGNYRDALAHAGGGTPDITAVRKDGAIKYGFSASFEQPLNDDGDTGLFARAAWNDGATESFAYTEAEQSFSLGLQISGKRWHRPDDHFAIALAQNGLSSAHRDYLAAGGLGFLLGDGKLNYGPERILESYYNYSVKKGITAGLDLQLISNPGYNKDRGPVPVAGFRLHFEF